MKIRSFLSTIILILVLSITVGFSAFVSEISISNIVADIRMQEDIRVTSVELVDGYEIISNDIDYDVDSVLGNVTFNSSDAIATYKITVTNIGNVDFYLGGYTYSGNVNVEPLDGTTQTVVSALGGTNEFSLMIYPSEYTYSYSPDFKIDFSFKNIYSVSYENLNLVNKTIIEGESYSEFIGDYGSNDIQVYMGGRQLSSNEYSYSYGQLIVSNVTGDLIIQGPKTLNSIMRMNSVLDTNVNFSSSEGLDVVNNITYTRNGTENNAYPIYYYRGNVTANNVVFGGFCWKMVRTTDTGGVKVIYNGVPASEGSCNNTGDNSRLTYNSDFDGEADSPSNGGWMQGIEYDYNTKTLSSQSETYLYGNDVSWNGSTYTLIDTISSSSWNDDKTTLATKYHYTCFNSSGSCSKVYYVLYFRNEEKPYFLTFSNGVNLDSAKDEMFANTNDSLIKKYVDSWYLDNMTSYTNLFEDTVFCSDRTTASGALHSKDYNAGGYSYFYNYVYNVTSPAPTLYCPAVRDRFTVSTTYGNGDLKYPVGLLTADEFTLAGSGNKSYVSTSYLNIGVEQWSMTPYRFNYGAASNYYVDEIGYLHSAPVDNNLGVRPAVSLKKNMIVVSGDGTVSSPYHIKSTFTIDGVSYEYEPGMTWGEWVDSDYNSLGVCLTDNKSDSSQMLFDNKHLSVNFKLILSNELIDSSISYVFVETHGGGD